MTTITTSITLDNFCNLTVTDTTGFYNSSTNTTGFLPETNTDALTFNVYKISDGYFLNVVLANKYAQAPSISNPSESFYSVLSGNVDNTTYANNFTPEVYQICDGTYTVKRFFIPSLAFYTANSSNAIYNGITMFYTDGTTIYTVISGVATAISVTVFLQSTFTNSNVLVNSTSFISTCNINNCYFKVLSSILEINIGKKVPHQYEGYDNYYHRYNRDRAYDWDDGDCRDCKLRDELMKKRDLLYMSLETIKYLKDLNNITQIQKLIEVLTSCGGACGQMLPPALDCGCNG